MLTTADILNLIRLNELELQKIYCELDSDDEETKNNAGEIVLQTEKLAEKLKAMYESSHPDYTVYPEYEYYLSILKAESMIRADQ